METSSEPNVTDSLQNILVFFRKLDASSDLNIMTIVMLIFIVKVEYKINTEISCLLCIM